MGILGCHFVNEILEACNLSSEACDFCLLLEDEGGVIFVLLFGALVVRGVELAFGSERCLQFSAVSIQSGYLFRQNLKLIRSASEMVNEATTYECWRAWRSLGQEDGSLCVPYLV